MLLPASESIDGAANFITDFLTGGLAVGLSTIAVAAIGFGMLTGRLHWRRSVGSILGCFLMLGAPAIARGILDLRAIAMPSIEVASPKAPLVSPPPAKPVQTVADPYAGASLVR